MPVLAPQKSFSPVLAKEKLRPAGLDWAGDFLFAGSSALLLHVSNLFPAYWYLSFVALLPFLYRIVKAVPAGALRLGFIFGLSFLSIALLDDLRAAPVGALAKFFSGLTLISLFGWVVGYGKQKWGFNPFLVSLLWVTFELGAIKLGFVSGFLEAPKLLALSPFFHGMAALFGFLAVSFVIVLVNSLLVLAMEKAAALSSSRFWSASEPVTLLKVYKPGRFVAQLIHLIPEGRAPPAPATV